MEQQKLRIIGVIAIGLIAIGGTATAVVLNKQTDTTPSSTTTTSSPNNTTPSISGTAYKNGSFSANGSYRTPGSTETISVSVTLKDDVITSVSVTGNGRGDSAEYQSMFKSGVSSLTVGKDIDDVKLSRVSGSSLTSTGFNSALDTIKTEARV
ncbi:FMN-binding protein [Candidatus Saccharibacteria bacterium]|nr:FMN-binding protein [Candidatus Saccharibacteria bacterium]MBH1972473.1 FMN-binding protein [Candidatus Saccharibacteria bacterium]MBH1990185.1 FMN-binding protein [Candidatus Saccharibacteria bacterium]